MSNPSNPSSPNPSLFNSNHPHNQTQSVPERIRAFLSNKNSTCSAPLPPPSYSNDTNSRCEGLDLLAMAVLEVDGDGAFEKNDDSIIESVAADEDDDEVVGLKKRRRQKAMPLRFQDSVLQPWKRTTRRSRSKKVQF